MPCLLITGTDTGVGKTMLTAALAAYWQTYRDPQALGIYKPVQSGEGDREFYTRTFKLTQTIDEVTPLHFVAPLAPAIAAAKEGRDIDLGLIWQKFQILQNQKTCLLVETLGGLGSPITYEYTVADLARDWHLPTILVVPVRLGAIGQSVANIALARLQKVNLKGIVLSCSQPYSNDEITDLADPELIQSLTNTQVWGVLPFVSDPQNVQQLAQAASALALEGLGLL